MPPSPNPPPTGTAAPDPAAAAAAAAAAKAKNKLYIKRFLLWFVCTLLALAPLWMDLFMMFKHHKQSEYYTLWRHGECYVAGVGLTVTGIISLCVGWRNAGGILSVCLGGICVILLVLASCSYGDKLPELAIPPPPVKSDGQKAAGSTMDADQSIKTDSPIEQAKYDIYLSISLLIACIVASCGAGMISLEVRDL